jgi:hypothetical protein
MMEHPSLGLRVDEARNPEGSILLKRMMEIFEFYPFDALFHYTRTYMALQTPERIGSSPPSVSPSTKFPNSGSQFSDFSRRMKGDEVTILPVVRKEGAQEISMKSDRLDERRCSFFPCFFKIPRLVWALGSRLISIGILFLIYIYT